MGHGAAGGTDPASDRDALVEAIRENTRRLIELEELARVGSWEWDVGANTVAWSDQMYRIFGVKPDEFEATYEAYLGCLHPDDRPLARHNVEQALVAREPYAADYRVVSPDAEIRWVHCRGRAISGAEGDVERLIGTAHDITDRKELESDLSHQALHDPLTGLPNRSLLFDRLAHAMQRTLRTGHQTAVLFIDLDHFKKVNDGAGHDAGDGALRTVAERLQGAVRQHDTVARYGGDEFVIVAEDVRWPDEARTMAARALEAAERPIAHPSGGIELSASIGLTMAASGTNPDEVLRNADTAMYRAKQRGGNTIAEFDLDDVTHRDE